MTTERELYPPELFDQQNPMTWPPRFRDQPVKRPRFGTRPPLETPEAHWARIEAAEAARDAELAAAVAEQEAKDAAEAESREVMATSTPEWPEPPTDAAYHGVAGKIVRAIAPYTEADPIGLLGSFLAIYSALIGDGWSFHQGEWQSPALYVANVGDTATGRKGTAYGNIAEVFTLAEDSWRNVIVSGLGSGEGLITHLTVNKDYPQALILETEFSRLLIVMTREGSTLSPIIRNAWDGVPLGRQVANAKQSGAVMDYHVCVLANITREDLAKHLTSTDAANGFGNRFLWLANRRSQLQPFTEPVGGHIVEYLPKLKEAIAFSRRKGTMKRTPAGDKWWNDFYRGRLPRGGLAGALTARAEPYVARLSMLYALLDQTATIDVAHLEAAKALWDYAERTVVYVFGDSTGDKHADTLLSMLRFEGRPLKYDEARRELGLRTAADMAAVIQRLEGLHLARLVKYGRGGRPRREIELVSR